MKKKKTTKKCDDCPPDECCHCKDEVKPKKKLKKKKLSSVLHGPVITRFHNVWPDVCECLCGNVYMSSGALERHLEDSK